jgi:cytoskeletal protein CcmA (bactofilin family)
VGGEVRGRDVVVAGVLHHGVVATHSIRLLASAEVYGDLAAPKVAIDEGAVFEGRVRMGRRKQEPATAEPVAAPSAAAPAAMAPATVQPPAPREIPSLPGIGKKKLVRRT